jgi:hypothetical protein
MRISCVTDKPTGATVIPSTYDDDVLTATFRLSALHDVAIPINRVQDCPRVWTVHGYVSSRTRRAACQPDVLGRTLAQIAYMWQPRG